MNQLFTFLAQLLSQNKPFFLFLTILFYVDWVGHRIFLPVVQTYFQYVALVQGLKEGRPISVCGPYESKVALGSDSYSYSNDTVLFDLVKDQGTELFRIFCIVQGISIIGFVFFWLINKRENRETKDKEDGKSGGGDNDKKDDKEKKGDNENERCEESKPKPSKGKGVPPQGLAGSESQKPDNDQKKDNGDKDGDKKAHSPLDQFSIVPLIPLKIGKLYFSFTNASFFLLLTLSFVLFVFHLVTKKGGGKLVPNAFQSVLELIYDFVLNLVNEQIGGLSGNVKQPFFPCILVTFTFLLFCNLQGMIPYSFTVTSHFIVTLGLSFSLFIGITIVGFVKNGLHFLSFLLPAGVPLPLAPFLVLLELISYCFRALSLGIRLFANMMAGHSLVKILSGFAWTMLCMNDLFYFIGSTGPFFIVLALTGLELGVAILQAYVFTILICIYLNDAINLH